MKLLQVAREVNPCNTSAAPSCQRSKPMQHTSCFKLPKKKTHATHQLLQVAKENACNTSSCPKSKPMQQLSWFRLHFFHKATCCSKLAVRSNTKAFNLRSAVTSSKGAKETYSKLKCWKWRPDSSNNAFDEMRLGTEKLYHDKEPLELCTHIVFPFNLLHV